MRSRKAFVFMNPLIFSYLIKVLGHAVSFQLVFIDYLQAKQPP
ncbi:MAG: hypothetical protein ACJAZC_002401 [Cryomorphaceae bacterium]|jgi:hypothetical protein